MVMRQHNVWCVDMIHSIIAESKYVSPVHKHSHPSNSSDLGKVSPLASSLSKPNTPLCMK